MAIIKYKNGSTWNNIALTIYPIGSLFLSSQNISPADIFGGTWVALTEGRLLRPAGAWGETGSSTITTSNMPAHNHITNQGYFVHWGNMTASETAVIFRVGTLEGTAIVAAAKTGSTDLNVLKVDNKDISKSRTVSTVGGGPLIRLSLATVIAGTEQHNWKKVA